MEEKTKESKYDCGCCDSKHWKHWHHRGHGGSSGGAVYGLGVIGALVYYFQSVVTFQEGLIAIFKSLTWPAFLIFRVLQLLKM